MRLDPHAKPPAYLQALFKEYRSSKADLISKDPCIVDPGDLKQEVLAKSILSTSKEHLRFDFGDGSESNCNESSSSSTPLVAYELSDIPSRSGDAVHGAASADTVTDLLLIPNAISVDVQKMLLDRLFHRDLSNSAHQTNVDLHYELLRPRGEKSFFGLEGEASLIRPKDEAMHRPMTVRQLLQKRLRWMTLGGQYDWLRKTYPSGQRPEFPGDLSRLLQNMFPDTAPEAAIVNLYSPGDTLSMHRDVSEDCDHGLISISIGCEALFVIGLDKDDRDEECRHAVIRLRSGDVLYMAGPSRFAWHGIPCVIPNSCPEELSDWPCATSSNGADEGMFCDWRGWLSGKRINLNVRQMREQDEALTEQPRRSRNDSNDNL